MWDGGWGCAQCEPTSDIPRDISNTSSKLDQQCLLFYPTARVKVCTSLCLSLRLSLYVCLSICFSTLKTGGGICYR
jgi:hypothetical protein